MTERRISEDEKRIPIAEMGGRYLTPSEMTQTLLREAPEPSVALLIERVKQRARQDRVMTTYRPTRIFPALTLEQQIEHMEAGDEIGKELLAAEKGWLNEVKKILEGQYG